LAFMCPSPDCRGNSPKWDLKKVGELSRQPSGPAAVKLPPHRVAAPLHGGAPLLILAGEPWPEKRQ
jgi:hypothetical protein